MKKTAVSDAYDVVQAADSAGEECIAHCKRRLQQKLGLRWSAGWEPTGFPNQSLATPSTQDERFTLLVSLKNYFTAVPAHGRAAQAGARAHRRARDAHRR